MFVDIFVKREITSQKFQELLSKFISFFCAEIKYV